MALTKLNPAWPVVDVAYPNRLARLLDEMFNFRTPPFYNEESGLLANWMPPVDVIEEKEGIRLVAELPGVKPEDVKITMENNVLLLRGEKKKEIEQKDERVHRFERNYGMFERSFTLPTTIDAGKIVATYHEGVLTVVLPKSEAAKPKQIAVKIEKAIEK